MPAKAQVAAAVEELKKEIESPDDLLHALTALRQFAREQLGRAARARAETWPWNDVDRAVWELAKVVKKVKFFPKEPEPGKVTP